MSPGATQSGPAGPETQTAAPRWERAAVAGLLVYFAARTLFLAWMLAPGVPPDEATHLDRIGLYSAVPFVPIDSAASAELGLVGHRPYLYYFSMGRLLQVAPAGIDELRFLRFANCILGLLTAWVAYRWIRLVSASPLVRLVFLVFVTNTLMYSGLFASVSYDNLANLLAALAVFELTRFCTERDPGSLVAFGLWAGLGILTKQTLLPLAAILLLVLLVRERRGLSSLLRDSWAWLRAPNPRRWLLGGLLLATAVACTGLYGANLVRYGRLVPGLEQVVGVQAAMENRIFARNQIVKEFRAGRLGHGEAIRMAEQIRHPGDRRDLKQLLNSMRDAGDERIGLLSYLGAWTRLMFEGIYGYYGHGRIIPGRAELAPFYLCYLLAALGLAWRGRAESSRRELLAAAVIVAGYAAVLIFWVHRPAYISTGSLTLAVQGRYLFPVLLLLYGLVATGLLALFAPRVRPLVALASAAYFIYADLPYLLARAPAAWWQAGPD
jgi:hypothetical protein